MKMLLISVAVIFVFAFLDKQAQAQRDPIFRPDYVYNEDFASFYKLDLNKRSWASAKSRCHREGAQLFYPSTKEEAEFVAALIKDKLPQDPKAWIGISDILSEGYYETIDGIAIEEIYDNWNINEPNNADNVEDCVEMSDETKMNDLPCNKTKPYICKKTLASVEWNHLCEVPDKAYLYNRDLDKCYKFHTKPLNWTEALAVCAAENSHLAVINSQKEADYFVKLITDSPKNYKGYYLAGAVHVGFYKNDEQQYITIHKTLLEDSGYTTWGGGQPDNPSTEFCGSIFYSGRLNDISCHNICYFICEHDIGWNNNIE